jgi:hypothetical protein
VRVGRARPRCARDNVQTSRRVASQAIVRARADTARTAASLDALLRGVVPLTQTAADDLGRDTLSVERAARRAGRRRDACDVLRAVLPSWRRPPRDDPSGVVFATVSLDQLNKALDSLALGTSGYAFVFSAEGHYLSHAQRDLVTSGATVCETAWESGDTTLHWAAIHCARRRSTRRPRWCPI